MSIWQEEKAKLKIMTLLYVYKTILIIKDAKTFVHVISL